MNGARVFEDAYSGVFREQEDFFSCLHEILGKSLWIRQKVRNLRLVPIIAGSTFEKELRSQYTEDGMDDGIITDTIANTALMLKYRGDMLPVRDCAIKSILDRAGIQGSGLRRVERNVYARILNDVLKVTKGEALLRISEGKVSAVLRTYSFTPCNICRRNLKAAGTWQASMSMTWYLPCGALMSRVCYRLTAGNFPFLGRRRKT